MKRRRKPAKKPHPLDDLRRLTPEQMAAVMRAVSEEMPTVPPFERPAHIGCSCCLCMRFC